MFLNANIFSNLNSNCSKLLDLRNFQEQVKKAFCYLKLFWPFNVWTNCSSDLKMFTNSQPSASNLKSFSWSLEQFFLTVGQNNFGNKIPLCMNFWKIRIFFQTVHIIDWVHKKEFKSMCLKISVRHHFLKLHKCC